MCWGARYIPGPWRCLCCNSCASWRAGSWHGIFGWLKHSLKVTETDIPAGKHWIKIHKEQPVPQGSDKAQYALVLLNLSSIHRQSDKTQFVWSPTTHTSEVYSHLLQQDSPDWMQKQAQSQTAYSSQWTPWNWEWASVRSTIALEDTNRIFGPF